MAKLVKPLGGISTNLNKKEIQNLASENAKAVVDSGDYDLLRVYVELKRYQVYLESLIKELKPDVTDKAIEHGKKSFVYGDAAVQIMKTRKFNYAIDSQWKSIDDEIAALKKAKKEREIFLKESHGKGTLIDEETGEIVEDFELPVEVREGINIRL